MRLLIGVLSLSWLVAGTTWGQQDSVTRQEAEKALHQALEFFATKISIEGGYLWRYSADLTKREGEGRATRSLAWVQPPGTPSVGEALLEVYKLTGDQVALRAARQTAHALVKGQLQSGGWDYRIEFDKTKRSRYAYRADGNQKGRNVTTLDDNTTQAALTYLIRFDKATRFQDQNVHRAVRDGLQALLQAQYPNGAWPQRFDRYPVARDFPVVKANYPESWSRIYQKRDYRRDYTFNDNTIADTIELMFLAAEVYDEKQYQRAAERAGDFIILAQMPEPQPAWAQQYNARTQPTWARKFEPPAVTGGESQQILRVLMSLYRSTGKKKFLEPIPAALNYLKRSRLPDGRLARFYELGTNKPLFLTKKYELTYQDDDLPTHYGFIVSSRLDSIEKQYQRLLKEKNVGSIPTGRNREIRKPKLTQSLSREASRVVRSQDARGAWVTSGRLRYHGDQDQTTKIIDCRIFMNNVRTLGRFLAASGL